MNKNPLEFMLSPDTYEGFGAEYRTCFMTRDALTDLSSDFTLPDYYPEIRKLLRIDTNVSPAGRYIGGSSVEFSGRVDYEMIYVTSDGEMASAPLGSDFTFDVPLSRPENALDGSLLEAVADSVAENVSGRVMSPRKVNIKCRLRSKVRGYCTSRYAPEIDSGAKFEKLTEDVIFADSRRYMGEEIQLSAQIPCDSESVMPVYGGADAQIKEISASNGLVSVSGMAHLKIVCNNNGAIEELCEDLPFACEIETDTHGDGGGQELWTAFPYVTETDISLEDGKLSANITLICHADLYRNTPMTVIGDIYSTDGEESVTSETLEYKTAIAAGSEVMKLNGELRPSNIQLSDTSRVIDSGAAASIEGCKFEDGKIKLWGKCNVTAVISSSGEFSTFEDEIPISLTVAADRRPQGEISSVCRGAVCGLECSLEGGVIRVAGNVYLSYGILEGRSASVIKAAQSKASSTDECGIIVCYPDSGETLWGISKKYRAPLSKVALENDLPISAASEPLPDNVKYLIVCK